MHYFVKFAYFDRFMRELLLLVTIHGFLRPVQSVNGVIWDRKIGDFVPIFSIPGFATANQRVLNQSRKQETHNFQGKIVRFSYYEETNLINSKENGTKVTGVIGEIWNILAEYLNFTLKPIHSKEQTLGFINPDGSYSSGVLKLFRTNETDVIPRVEAHVKRLSVAQLTLPLWKTSYRMYIRREVKHLPTWMLKLFSRRVWYAILLMYILLSSCSYVSQMIGLKITRKKSTENCSDHFFYNFGMICGQSYFLSNLSNSSKIVEFWLGLFSCLIRTAFGALLIVYMTQTTSTPPFHDLISLIQDTSYNIYTLKGSLPHLLFKVKDKPEYAKAIEMKRYFVANSVEEMHRITCLTGRLYAIYQSEDVKKARGVYICRLNPAGISLFDAWIVSGISLNFKYKRSIDIGILKLYEVGFIQLLKHRWINSKNIEEEAINIAEPIIMEQVYLILLVFSGGLLISFIILLFENLTFYYKNC